MRNDFFYFTFNLFQSVAAKRNGDAYVEVVIGVLTAVVLLLLIVFLVVLIINRRHKLQGSPTLFRNPFGVKMNMKVRFNCLKLINSPNVIKQDLLMNFSPGTTQNNTNHSVPITPVSRPDSRLENISPMTYEEYRSSLASNYYGTDYATLR